MVTISPVLMIIIVIATIASGLLSGIVLNQVSMDFPARHKLGTLAYADFERATDLGNGRFVVPPLAVGGVILKLVAFFIAISEQAPSQLLIPLGLAVFAGLLILVSTVFAGPNMLRIGRTENREELVAPLLERFVRYSYIRAIFVWLDFVMLLWTLLVV